MTKLPRLTLGTARVTRQDGRVVLQFMGHGNFSVGEQHFGTEQGARAWAAERDLRVL